MTSRTRYPVFIALALLLMSVAGLDSSAYARHRRYRDGCCPVAINPCPTCPAPAPVISCPAPQPVISCPAPAPVISCPAPQPVISCPAPCPAPAPVILRRVVTVTCCPVTCPEKKEEVTPAPVVEEKPAPEPAPAPVINVPEPEPLPPAPAPRPRRMKL
jgi:hypothetical protein